MKAFLIIRVGICVFLGTIWRFLRRVARRPPRIWHGHWPVLMTPGQVRIDRTAGFPSRAVATEARLLSYALITEKEFDRILLQPGVRNDAIHWLAIADLHLHGDIWAAHFDCLPFPANQKLRNRIALRMARVTGIRIVVMPHGTDIVRNDLPPTRYDWIGRLQKDYPNWNFDEQTVVSSIRLDQFSSVAHLVIAPEPATARLMNRVDLIFKYYSAPDVAPLPSTGESSRVRIVHAPNHRNVKGTDFLLESCAHLRERGFQFELTLVERVPRAEAIALYRQADIIADQFCIGAFGVFAVESLAMGKPVLAYLDDEHLTLPQLNLPVVNACLENLAIVLASLIAVPELRGRLAIASREAFERFQSPDALAEVWRRIYRWIWWGEPMEIEKTRTFSSERSPRPSTRDPREEEFWTVGVGDLMPRIRSAIKRAT